MILELNETKTAIIKFAAPADAEFGQVSTVSATVASGGDENFIFRNQFAFTSSVSKANG